MFEKASEEYGKMISEGMQIEKGSITSYTLSSAILGFKDGANFGYKTANEWHYMKDGDFPPENVPLNIITFDKDKKRRLWEGEYKGGNGQWWTGYFNHFIDVPYAWKKIILPEELKESK